MEFSVGMKVKCVNIRNPRSDLEIGKTYLVTKIHRGDTYIWLKGQDCWWTPEQFVPAEMENV